MTAKARALFFAANPVIDTDRQTFERHCQTQVSKNTVELGCFTSDNRIYILKIDDSTLSKEMGVVAAHEMLHAAYSQMSTTDRTMLDGQLETVVSGIQDRNLLQRLKDYRTLEPGQRDNELHSILGTEFDSLGIDLEQYYTLYFSDDRRAVLAAAQQIDQVYTQKEDELVNIQNRIKQMRKQMQNDMDQNKMGDYNQLVPQINALIKEFNQKVRAYNALSRSLMGEETPANNQ